MSGFIFALIALLAFSALVLYTIFAISSDAK